MVNNILNSGKLLTLRPELAELVGINEALFLGQLHFWLERSKHHHDGRPWVYNSVDQWAKQFTFWSKRTLERALASLREQELILTTTDYNRWSGDNRLWYTIDYEKLSAISSQPPANRQIDAFSTDDKVADAYQDDGPESSNMADGVRQDDSDMDDNVADTLYTENTNRDLYKDQTITEVVVDDFCASDPQPVTLQPCDPATFSCHAPHPETQTSGSGSECHPTKETPHPCSTVSVSQLQSHGLSEPSALSLAQQYAEEYLQEKISYLEYELDRRPEMTNPAGWLRCAIEQNYAAPPGYYAAQKTAAEKEKWQAIAEEHQQQILESIDIDSPENGTLTRADKHGEPAPTLQPCNSATFTTSCHAPQKVQGSGLDSDPTLCDLPDFVSPPCNSATLQPLPSMSKEIPLTQSWEKGYTEVAEFMPIGNLLESLQQSLLLSFKEGHATIGVKCQYALQRLQMRGRHILRNALNFGLGELLQGRRATYELVLV